MTARDILKREFDGEAGSFLLRARCELVWDWDAFHRLTSAMYEVADQARRQPSIETWIAHGFWFCNTWIKEWTGHPDFPRPPEEIYRNALGTIHELSSFLFTGVSPYDDDTLQRKSRGDPTGPDNSGPDRKRSAP